MQNAALMNREGLKGKQCLTPFNFYIILGRSFDRPIISTLSPG